MAELKLVSNVSKKPLFYKKNYTYGAFEIVVIVDGIDESTYDITAKTICRECEIVKTSHGDKATMTFPAMYVQLDNMEEFLGILKEGRELLEIIENQVDELIKIIP